MIVEMNKSYLIDELSRAKERLQRLEDFIRTHPSKSIRKRVLRGHVYFYEKFSQGGKAVDRYLCRDEEEMKKYHAQFIEEKANKAIAKEKRKQLRMVVTLLERQLKVLG
jgi:hypothetical protein